MPLKGKQLVVYPLKTLWRALSITPNHNPHVTQRFKTLMTMAGMGKLDHLEERLRAIEGGEDYAFANLEELFLIPKHGHSQVQGAGLWQVQGDYLLQEPSKDVLSEDGGIRKR